MLKPARTKEGRKGITTKHNTILPSFLLSFDREKRKRECDSVL